MCFVIRRMFEFEDTIMGLRVCLSKFTQQRFKVLHYDTAMI